MSMKSMVLMLIGLMTVLPSQTAIAISLDEVDITGVYHYSHKENKIAYIYRLDGEESGYLLGFNGPEWGILNGQEWRTTDKIAKPTEEVICNQVEGSPYGGTSRSEIRSRLNFTNQAGQKLRVKFDGNALYLNISRFDLDSPDPGLLDGVGSSFFHKKADIYKELETLGPFTGTFCGYRDVDDITWVCFSDRNSSTGEAWIKGFCHNDAGDCPQAGARVEYSILKYSIFNREKLVFDIDSRINQFHLMDVAYYAEKKVTERQLKLLNLLNGRWAGLNEGDTNEYVFALAKPEAGSVIPKQLEFTIFGRDRAGRIIPLPSGHTKMNIIEIKNDLVIVQAESGKDGKEYPLLQIQRVEDNMFYMRGPDVNLGFFRLGDL